MIAAPVRQYLKEEGLQDKVTCLVTFYGVPLRVGVRLTPQDEQRELAALDGQKKKLAEEVQKALADLEGKALAADASFKPAALPPGAPQTAAESPEWLARRAEWAYRALARHVDGAATPAERLARSNELLKQMQALGGPATVVRAMAGHLTSPQTPDDQRRALTVLADQVQKAHDELMHVQQNPYDAASRARF